MGNNSTPLIGIIITTVVAFVLVQEALVPVLAEQANAPGVSPRMGSMFGLAARVLDSRVLLPVGAIGGVTALALWMRKAFRGF